MTSDNSTGAEEPALTRLTEKLAAYKREERHQNVAETRYWLNQYKQLAQDALTAFARTTPPTPAPQAVEKELSIQGTPNTWQLREVYFDEEGQPVMHREPAPADGELPPVPKTILSLLADYADESKSGVVPDPTEPDGTFFEILEAVRTYAEQCRAMGGQIPEGWKLVPIEPTIEMLEADWNVSLSDAHTDHGVAECAWAAMLSAAPAKGEENG